jgi:hypothetical protein
MEKRTLKGTINHKMRSIMRFFVQFSDHTKNEAIQSMTTNPLLRRLSGNIQSYGGEFINLVLMSYEVGDLSSSSADRTKQCVQFSYSYIGQKRPAGVVVFGYKHHEIDLLKWLKGAKTHPDIQYFADEQCAVVRKLGYEVVKRVLNADSCMLIFGNDMVVQNTTEIRYENLGGHDNTLTICKLYVCNSSMVFLGANCSSFPHFCQLLEKSHEEAFQSDRLGQARSSSILELSYRTVLGNTSSGNSLDELTRQCIREQLENLRKKGDLRSQSRLIGEVADKDQLSCTVHCEDQLYLKNYMEGPLYFLP